MKTYCIKCNKETNTTIVRTKINEKKKEKKVIGYCNTCTEPSCQIISINNTTPKE